MYFPRNWEFGSAVSKLRNLGEGGGLNPNPPRYATAGQHTHLFAECLDVILLETDKNFTMTQLTRNRAQTPKDKII
jgi:hypothetical protein